MLPGTTYYYAVHTGVMDVDGLALAQSAIYQFTAGPALDSTPPQVSAVSPSNTTTGVGTNAPIEILFSEPLNPITVNSGTIQISSGGSPIAPVTINFLSGSAQAVVLTPIEPLPANATVNIALAGVQDLSGNSVAAFNSSFQTAAGADLTRPSVILTDPFGGSSTAPTNTAVTIEFNEPMDPVTISSSSISLTDTVTGLALTGAWSTSPNGMTAAFAPSSALAVGRQYKLAWTTAAHDLAGNLLNASSITFTTALVSSSTTPAVVLSTPENGLTGIPTNALLEIAFNEPVQSSAIQDVSLSANGTNVAGTVNSMSSGNMLLTITPSAPLAPNTAYVMNVVGIQDLAGNILTPSVTEAFTTGAGADLTSLSIVGANPPAGFVGVGTNINPTIVFSKRMNPISLNNSTVRLKDNSTGQLVAIAVTPSADRTSVMLQPASALAGNTQYTFTLNGATDLVGNVASGSWTFTTGSGPDTTPPTITAMNPPNGAVSAINVTLLFTASSPISPLSFTQSAVVLTTGNTGIAGTATLESDLQTIKFKPKANLAASTSYSVAVSGFTDLLGNPVTPFSGSFSTGTSGTPNTTAPTVSSTVPASGATGVSVTATITINFSQTIDPITANPSDISVYLTANNATIPGTFSTSGSTVTFTPTYQLPGNQQIEVSIANVEDYVGNNNTAYSFTFTTANTADTTPPAVTSITPANNSANLGLNTQVVVTFSKPISPSTVNAKNFGMFANSSRLTVTTTYSAEHQTVTLSAGALPANSTIQVTISNVVDLSGNPLASFESSFTTVAAANANQPSVTAQLPANGAASVPVNSLVTLYLSKAMDPASTTAAMLVSQNGSLVQGSAVLAGNGQVLTFTPANPFAGGAVIQVFLQNSALDTFGNNLNAYNGSFTVAPNLTATPPVVTGTIPGAASGVVLNPVIEVQYSKALNPATVTSANAGLFVESTSQSVPVNLTLRGSQTVRMTPVSALAPNTLYYYQITTGLADTTGLSPATTYSQTFTTGTASGTTQPRVMSVTPPNTSVAVGVNAPVTLQFSEPLNTLTVSAGAGGTIQLAAGANAITPASVSFGSSQDVTIVPYEPFPANTAITVSATSGLQDPSGNALVPFSSSFTTGSGPDLTPVQVLTASPPSGTQNVPLNTYVQLTTSRAIDPTTVNGNSLTLFDQTTGNPLVGTWSTSPNGMVVSFLPSPNLIAGHSYEYSWTPSMQDIDGNFLNAGNATFTASSAADTTPPTVIATNPPNGFTNVRINLMVQILFSEPIQASSISAVTLTPNGGSPLNVTMVLSNANQTLTLVPPTLLAPATQYTLTVAGIVDIANNALASILTYTFTTGAGAVLAAPTELSLPTSDATGVSRSVAATATFPRPSIRYPFHRRLSTFI